MKCLGRMMLMVFLLSYGVSLLAYDAPVVKESSAIYRRHIPCLPDARTVQICMGMLIINAAAVLMKSPTRCAKLFVILVMVLNLALQGTEHPELSQAANFEAKLTGGRFIAMLGGVILV